MPRQLRIQYPGACYHVLARGNRRNVIVTDDDDRKAFVATLSEACGRTGWEVLAWVLMDNHYHLLIRTPEANLVDGMKWFQNAYTRRFNVRNKAWGHLFGGRYKAIPVELPEGEGEADYLTTLMDYIHLNPVRAKLVKAEEGKGLLDYAWSSLATAYAVRPGAKRPRWMAVADGLKLFGCEDTAHGRRAFVERLEERIKRERAKDCGRLADEVQTSGNSTLKRGWYWGSQAFMEKLQQWMSEAGEKPKGRTLRASAESRAGHDEAQAKKLLKSGLKELGLEGQRLGELPGSDPRKVAVAAVIRAQTSMPNGWIAERLKMKSPDNVSQHVRRLGRGEFKLDKETRKWLKQSMEGNCNL